MVSHPTIKKGSWGDSVKLCQELLTKHGFATSADGDFGSGTDSKVKAFQKSKGLTADGIVGQGTWATLEAGQTVTKEAPGPLPLVLQHALSLGHKVPWLGDFHLWLFGVRSKSRQANSFDDMLGCAYTENGMWRVRYWPGTTDPGTYWMGNPGRISGTAILVPDQYLDTWKIDLHGGKYKALCQRAGEVAVYRDPDKDNTLEMDPNTIEWGYFGINLHRSSNKGESTKVWKWSAGCQVHAKLAGFDEMMELAHKQVKATGRETFNYTLMDVWK